MLNKVLLIGNVGKDPQVTSMKDGKRVASFSLATSKRSTDHNGEKKNRTEWHRVAIWSKGLVDVVDKYVRKGSKVWIEGELATRKWTDQSGTDRYVTEVVLFEFSGKLVLLDKASGGGVPAAESENAYGSSNDFEPDDDIPF